MRIPLTKYGWPQVVVIPLALLAAMGVCPLIVRRLIPNGPPSAFWATEFLLLAVMIFVFAFFRDPYRPVPPDKNILLAPADGKVTDIEIVDENDFIGASALRIGIFLSIFDVHINRAPCNVKVQKIIYKPGRYKNAMKPHSGRVNESNDLALIRIDGPADRLIVRQISGAIARRIVCATTQGQKLTCGEKFGMIKFGSRTELYVPVREDAKCLIRVGDKVKAGLSPLVRYE
jgi:phosphatidylserine decarboxylase